MNSIEFCPVSRHSWHLQNLDSSRSIRCPLHSKSISITFQKEWAWMNTWTLLLCSRVDYFTALWPQCQESWRGPMRHWDIAMRTGLPSSRRKHVMDSSMTHPRFHVRLSHVVWKYLIRRIKLRNCSSHTVHIVTESSMYVVFSSWQLRVWRKVINLGSSVSRGMLGYVQRVRKKFGPTFSTKKNMAKGWKGSKV